MVVIVQKSVQSRRVGLRARQSRPQSAELSAPSDSACDILAAATYHAIATRPPSLCSAAFPRPLTQPSPPAHVTDTITVFLSCAAHEAPLPFPYISGSCIVFKNQGALMP